MAERFLIAIETSTAEDPVPFASTLISVDLRVPRRVSCSSTNRSAAWSSASVWVAYVSRAFSHIARFITSDLISRLTTNFRGFSERDIFKH